MSTKIVGVDPSLTGTGICSIVVGGLDFGDGAGCHTSLVKPVNKSGPERLVEIRSAVLNTIQGADIVVIEGYAHSKHNKAHAMGELGGVLRVLFHETGVRWIEAAPGQLKKFACGKGNANKNVVMLGVYKRWGIEFDNDNICDAFVLAKIGEAMVSENVRDELIKPQQEVIDQLTGGVDKKGKAKSAKGDK